MNRFFLTRRALLTAACCSFGYLATAQSTTVLAQKSTQAVCVPAELTGLSACVDMQQTQYLKAPSGNETAVWKGTVPTGQRPAKTVIKDATWQERSLSFTTHAVITADGKASLTLQYKANPKFK
ncbi:hypothetical protein [Hymenobacter guriensis]|uniref:Uncharacterized protein n=1 Tax=Hymenobacter guriensis TaxID=2793065 RepID=A0ABS0L5P0_9BACT|nr:hypothetical protein [Hymenobacter guriensis]MBG8555240.1 hypothetical protein [Hymenobacter guriensis]